MEAYKLHPLALVNISDHYIRFKAQLPPEEEPPRVLGCLLGFQEGNRDLEICNSFELIWTPEEGTGRVIVDAEYLAGQKVRYKIDPGQIAVFLGNRADLAGQPG